MVYANVGLGTANEHYTLEPAKKAGHEVVFLREIWHRKGKHGDYVTQGHPSFSLCNTIASYIRKDWKIEWRMMVSHSNYVRVRHTASRNAVSGVYPGTRDYTQALSRLFDETREEETGKIILGDCNAHHHLSGRIRHINQHKGASLVGRAQEAAFSILHDPEFGHTWNDTRDLQRRQRASARSPRHDKAVSRKHEAETRQ